MKRELKILIISLAFINVFVLALIVASSVNGWTFHSNKYGECLPELAMLTGICMGLFVMLLEEVTENEI